MKYILRILIITSVLTLLVIPATTPSITAQSEETESCPQIVQLALDNVTDLCGLVGDNQACYGHVLVDAQPQVGVANFSFEEEGDIEELTNLQAIRLSPMDMVKGVWGVAVLKLRAYMQYTDPEVVTFLLFGDADIENRVNRVESIEVAATAYSNVRLRPSPNAGVLGVLAPGTTTEANGRTEDGMWVRVILPENGRVGWTYVPNLNTDADIDTLEIVDGNASYFGPMQAFTLRSGINDSACPESPQSGMLIQTPEGLAEVTLLVNEVSIQLQATAFVQADPGGEMSVGVLSGQGWVEANGVRQPVFAGTQVRIPISEDLTSTAAPTGPEPYELADLSGLPLALLDNPVEVSNPLSAAEIARLLTDALVEGTINSSINGTTSDSTTGTTSDDATQTGLPPGLDGVAPPGQGGTPPGQGGEPPGQSK